MIFAVSVKVMPKATVADPQGLTIERALSSQDGQGIKGVRVGKLIRFELDAPNESAARELLDRICTDFLSNPVIEDYKFRIKAKEGATT